VRPHDGRFYIFVEAAYPFFRKFVGCRRDAPRDAHDRARRRDPTFTFRGICTE